MSVWHLLILAFVVVMVFGTGKLSGIGSDFGSAIRGFKRNLNDEDESPSKAQDDMEVAALSSESSVRQADSERVDKP
ncbi:MAG: twin-arginine translocase TatA/TatE family subunit [Rhodanobacter sp.]|nr:MAG: twin-arginine translocase TatA/TatE family subunit [Rhodanobacter sp.]